MKNSTIRTPWRAVALFGLGLAACSCSSSSPSTSTSTSTSETPSSTSSTSADLNPSAPPTTLGSNGGPPTTAAVQLHGSSAPTDGPGGRPPCDASAALRDGHIAVTVRVAGPADVQVTAPGAKPATEGQVVEAGSDGVTVYMNTAVKETVRVDVYKNRLVNSCSTSP